jgi:aspartyl-tRNA(Asn)/glutamyl-tRNA(Gln) amidotransferase subunit B
MGVFEELARGREPKAALNWLCNDLFGHLKAATLTLEQSPVRAAGLGELMDMVGEGLISARTAKEVLGLLMGGEEAGATPRQVVERRGMGQISDEARLRELARALVADPASQKQLKQYRDGRVQMMRYFVGQAMKATEGRANPIIMEQILKEELAPK